MVCPNFSDPCGFYWGSHGCDRLKGHEGVHRCGEDALDDTGCSEYNEETGECRYILVTVYEGDLHTGYDHEWSEWHAHGYGFRL